MLAKKCSKFSKPGFSSIWTMNFQMFKLWKKRQRNQRSNCQHPLEKQESSRKTSISALLTSSESLTVWITTNCGKFFKKRKYQTTWLASWEISMQVEKQQLELDMEQQTNSKLGKEYTKAVYCHPAYLNYVQSTSCKIPGWMKHKLEWRLLGKISITSDTQMTLPLRQKVKKN